MSTSTDVVVTGLGATTPLGGDVASTWDALLAGRSGVSRISDEWAQEFPAQLVARLATDPAEQIDRVRARRLDRSQQVAVVAAQEAWAQSGAADATPEKSFTEDLDVDSLSMVEIATAVEDKFGVAIPDDELGNIKTVGDAMNYIEANQG